MLKKKNGNSKNSILVQTEAPYKTQSSQLAHNHRNTKKLTHDYFILINNEEENSRLSLTIDTIGKLSGGIQRINVGNSGGEVENRGLTAQNSRAIGISPTEPELHFKRL